ncbi:MAG: hypothetical protein KCHDKBKB_00740 [Elusimicrobia bacterium]|nr:hypothetical protein [Elusimicrobiota bacterium]
MDEKYYKTNSLPLASYLSCKKDLKFVGVNKADPRTILFIFEPAEAAEAAADEYFAGGGSCTPLEIHQHYRSLKDLIFEAKRNSQAGVIVE